MHSIRAERRRRLAAVALLAALGAPGHAQDAGAPAASASVSASAVDAPIAAPVAASAASSQALAIAAAAKTLQADPLLSGKHMTHTFKWKTDPKKAAPDDHPADPSWFAWLRDFVRFLNDTSRLLFYGLVLAIVAVLLVGARHLVQLRSFRRRAAAVAAVSHVRDLDVRPESLPADIGAAAHALWRAGQAPAALSLLYRGALSRLIHRHAVPISASTTEGECLDLARGRLDAGALRYLTQVVRAWEASSYGNRALSDAMGEALCSGFATRFDAADAEAAA